MPQCPQCNKPLRELLRRCPTCQADLDLLVDYVSHLQGGLQRAENLTRAGELDQAVWAYLAILETDPDNVTARKQIGKVVTAVRQFDTSSPVRRWAAGLPPEEPKLPLWHRAWPLALAGILVIVAFAVGVGVGTMIHTSSESDPNPPKVAPPADNNRLGANRSLEWRG